MIGLPEPKLSELEFQTEQRIADWDIEVLFDGDCPLCKREIALIRRRDTDHRIRFTDIADKDFDERDVGKTMPELMAEIHGRLPDGTIVVGVDVFRYLYDAIGFHRLVRLTRQPAVSWVLDRIYQAFAKFRLKLASHRCSNGACST